MKYELIDIQDNFIIINKVCGVTFEGHEGVLHSLREEFPEAYGVHRLDKDTSGLMIFARNKESQRVLSEMFAKKLIQKTYLALSLKRPLKKMGHIKGDLKKGRGGNYYLTKTQENPSHTVFKSFYDEANHLRVFELKPLTGQTHQLRVHLKSIGSPILGDRRYSNDKSDRMYLAAIKLEFELDSRQYTYKFTPTEGEYFVSNDFLRKIIEA